jgi:hypothetical protein
VIIEKTRTGGNKFLIPTPLARIAVISLSAESRPKQTKMPSNPAIGMEKVRIPGEIYKKINATSFRVTFF